jgi:hypothetical protein
LAKKPGRKPKAGRQQLQLNLLENGIDFVRSGIEDYFQTNKPDARVHKYAVLHIFAGVLLLLKERLSREHTSLIFAKVEEAGNEGATTVNFDQAVLRLRRIAHVDLDQQMPILREGQRIRNALEHYEVKLDLKQTQEIVGKLCSFVYVFMRDELGELLEKHLKPAVWNRVQDLRGIAEEMVAERRRAWQKRVSHYAAISDDEVENLWRDAPRPAPDDGIFVFSPLECPQCSQDRVIAVEPGLALCTNPQCKEVYHTGSCLRCSGMILEEGEGFCPECLDYMDRD